MSVLVDAVQRAAQDRRANVALCTADGDRLSYAQLIDLADRAAAALAAEVPPGSVVATRLRNGPGYVAVILALARAGLVHLPVPVPANAEHVRAQLARTGARLIVREHDNPIDTAGVPDTTVDALTSGPVRPLPAGEPHRGPFRLQETTGSTGTPKLVVWRQDDLLADRLAWLAYIGGRAGDRYLTMHPLDVAHSSDVHLFPALLSGARLVLSDPHASPGRLLDDLDRGGATVFSALPRHYELLAAQGGVRLPRLRLPLCGGAYLAPEVITAARDRLGVRIRRIYGSTEFGIVLGNLDDVPQEELGMGPLPGVDLRVLPLAADRPAVGELVARSAHTATGYHDDPAATAAAFRDGWYHTGDVGERLPDGRHRILGRRGDAVPAEGQVWFAPQLEARLTAGCPVLEAAVLPPVPGTPDTSVVIVPDGDPAAAVAAVERLLAGLGVAARVTTTAGLPHTPVGKLDKPVLRAAVQVV